MFGEIKKFVEESFNKSIYGSGSIKHFERTVDWLKYLKPDADEPMMIAAYAHDIERAYRQTDSVETFKDKSFNDPEFLENHQTAGAKIITDFLQQHNYDEESIKRIYEMIRHHEVGGTDEANLIKDADSISYLESNAAKHIKMSKDLGIKKVREKIDWMYDRISSDEAKQAAEKYYLQALELASEAEK